MNNPRMFLWLGLLFLVWLNVSTWMKDYGPVMPFSHTPAATEAPAGSATPATGAGTTSTTPLAESLPSLQQPGAAATSTTAARPAATPAPSSDEAALAGAPTIHVVTDVLDMQVSLIGGTIVRADLLRYPVKKDDPNLKVRLFNTDNRDSLYVYESGLTTGRAGQPEPNHNATFTAPAKEFRLAPGQDTLDVPLTWTDAAGVKVTKTYHLRRGHYEINVTYDVDNGSTQPVEFAPYAQLLRHWLPVKRSMFNVETYAFRGPAVYDGEKYRKLNVEDKDDEHYSQTVTGGWVAGLQHHFVAAIIPPAGEPYHYSLKVQGKDYLIRTVGPTVTIAPGQKTELHDELFVGPKLQKQLAVAGPQLQRAADYGKLTILAQPLFWLLEKVHSVVGNWGWTIIIVTFLIKLAFYKLSETGGRSMAKMRTVGPRMKAIQERYKDDREAQARAMMELYKREKINPVGGCLPMVVQIPFFLAFYWVLLESVEMRQAPFMFWIQDLSSRDPYFILPALMGVAMFLQYRINPRPPDPVQAKVFAFMPIVMTAMFAWFPAGLVLYWLTNTLLSMAQQWKINKLVEADTIVAAATPAGRGGIGVVRISGPATRRIAAAMLDRLPAPRRASFARFRDAAGEALDAGIVLLYPEPASFTGEDVLELQGHGGPVVMDALVRRALELGARLARPGEFTERAFLNGKIDLAQAEAVADLIEAGSAQAARAAMRSLQGEFSREVQQLAEALGWLRTYVEAAIDFPDEDAELLADPEVAARLADVDARFARIAKAAGQGRLLRDGLDVVIAGRPNAGKSSLLNALAGYDAAIVTPVPGTTRDVLRERIHVDGLPVHVVDTAGLRETDDMIEGEGVRRARGEIARAGLVLYVIDATAAPDAAALAAQLAELPAGVPVLEVWNKVDLLARGPSPQGTVPTPSGRVGTVPAGDRPPVRIYVSTLTGAGLDALRRELKARAGYEEASAGAWSARTRHLDALSRAHAAAARARDNLAAGRAFELVAEELRLAQRALGEITGEETSEDLLGRIFASFCIGK